MQSKVLTLLPPSLPPHLFFFLSLLSLSATLSSSFRLHTFSLYSLAWQKRILLRETFFPSLFVPSLSCSFAVCMHVMKRGSKKIFFRHPFSLLPLCYSPHISLSTMHVDKLFVIKREREREKRRERRENKRERENFFVFVCLTRALTEAI